MHRHKLFSIIVSVILVPFLYSCSQSIKTEILVVGTTHAHHIESNYTYYDLVNILSTFNPDVICVEIPDFYFRKQSYLYEMMLASCWGFEQNKPVYPIDSWASATGGNDRALRNEYVKTEEYAIKEQEYMLLEESNETMQNFIRKYGELGDLVNRHDKGYDFFNGKEYNDFVREMYSINISVFGDGCMNLSYLTRNEEMLKLINAAVAENRGKRIIIFTGAEHKHYFDDKLSESTDLKLIDFENILPLKKVTPSLNILDMIEKNLVKGYYDVSSKSDGIDMVYSGALISLLHGPDMDHNPNIIPLENLNKAKPILDEWQSENPNSAYIQFELAWVKFLERDYDVAITLLKKIEDRLNEIPETSRDFVTSIYYRNLGLCHDGNGNRKEAVSNYQKGIEICKTAGKNQSYIEYVYKIYFDKL